MKRQRKSLVVIFILAGIVVFLAMRCASLPEKEPDLIAIIIPSSEYVFYKTAMDAAKAKAETLGYETLVMYHEWYLDKELKHITTAINRKVTAIIWTHGIYGRFTESVRRIKESGIPLFMIFSDENLSDISVSEIMVDDYQGARLAGEEFVRLMGGSGNYAVLFGVRLGPMESYIRLRVYEDVFEEYPDMKLVAQQYVSWWDQERYMKKWNR